MNEIIWTRPAENDLRAVFDKVEMLEKRFTGIIKIATLPNKYKKKY